MLAITSFAVLGDWRDVFLKEYRDILTSYDGRCGIDGGFSEMGGIRCLAWGALAVVKVINDRGNVTGVCEISGLEYSLFW